MTLHRLTSNADRLTRRGVAFGLGAAFLFGLSTPLAKLLLPATGALSLAALLYLGAGCGLAAFSAARRFAPWLRAFAREPGLSLADIPMMAGVIVAGGVAGPILMLFGLNHLSAAAAALMLNLEVPFTIVLAAVFFGEHLGRREALGAALVVIGGAILSWPPRTVGLAVRGAIYGDLVGVCALSGACLCWALDNNLTQHLSVRDPVVVARTKALCAGFCTLVLAGAFGQGTPVSSLYLSALLVGLVSYGLSLVLYVYAQRILGSARQAGLFATAPFIGALASVALLGERLEITVAAGGLVMACGLWVMFARDHFHEHFHDALAHDHLHVHDLHHQHSHDQASTAEQPHAHWHYHLPVSHAHPHLPDVHHRHRHN
jgi:drug/metabolite transporter (DMT)-like permease